MPTDIALISLATPVAEFPAIAREAETRGYRTAWVGEASGAEAIVLSTVLATHTQTLKIANGVIPVQTRTPIVYGQAAATLAHLAPGRFALGLGLSSEIIVGQWHGLPFTPSIQQMREAVQIIRMTAAGERVNFEGRFYRLKNFRLAIEAAPVSWTPQIARKCGRSVSWPSASDGHSRRSSKRRRCGWYGRAASPYRRWRGISI
jgi:alkanesulfonate monooxygenase SsuD/methylene tetrahydromethanopterin reductase-like flavin-dependent oxidoreductase (luciferase family)